MLGAPRLLPLLVTLLLFPALHNKAIAAKNIELDLGSDLSTFLNKQEQAREEYSQPSPQPRKKNTNPKSRGFFSKFKITMSDLVPQTDEVETRAKKDQSILEPSAFPDPTFSDIVYPEKRRPFETYAYLYNDKTNESNKNIPTAYPTTIKGDILRLAQDPREAHKLRSMVKAVKESRLAEEINYTDQHGNTPLLIAIRHNNYWGIKYLLQARANPNICNYYQICPIHMAIYNNKQAILELLIQHGVNISTKDNHGHNGIEYAISHDQWRVFKVLIDVYRKQNAHSYDIAVLKNVAIKNQKEKYLDYINQAFREQPSPPAQSIHPLKGKLNTDYNLFLRRL